MEPLALNPHSDRAIGLGRPSSRLRARSAWFVVLVGVSLLVFHSPLAFLVGLAWSDERYTYVLAVPLIAAILFWWKHEEIFRTTQYAPKAAAPFLAPALLLWIGSAFTGTSAGSSFGPSLRILSMVLVWGGAFAVCYGLRALRAAVFPWMYLALITPLPPDLMEWATVALQRGSADVSYWIFKLIRVPFLRDGFRFSLPGVNIEIAEECSGIRSSLSLFLTGILISQFALRSHWGKVALILAVLPIVILKNAVRIVTISMLGVYVDRGFLYGNLHHHGGLAFGLLGLGLIFGVLLLLQKAERTLIRPTETAIRLQQQ